jgi:hypothetical protein
MRSAAGVDERIIGSVSHLRPRSSDAHRPAAIDLVESVSQSLPLDCDPAADVGQPSGRGSHLPVAPIVLVEKRNAAASPPHAALPLFGDYGLRFQRQEPIGAAMVIVHFK